MSNAVLDKSIKADEKNFPGGFMDDSELSFVHFSKKEVLIWDAVQGGPYIEEEEGYLPLRSYRPLGQLIKEPQFMDFVFSVKQQSGKDGIPDTPELKQSYEQGMEMSEKPSQGWQAAPGDDIPEIAKMASKGKDGDTVMVYMPSNVIYALGMLGDGTVHINPSTGFPEFFFGKIVREVGRVFKSNPVREVVRIGATVAGAVMGGPLGAMAGSALGSATTGRDPSDWLNQALKAGALTYGAQALAPHIPGFGAMGAALGSSGIPGFGALGGTMSGWANPAAAGAMGGAGTAAGAQGGNAVNYVGLKGVNGGGQAAGMMGGAAPQAGGLSGLMSNPLVQAAPYALNIASGFMAKKGENERYRLEKEEREDLMRQQRAREEELLRKSGFYEPLKHYEHEEAVINPNYGQDNEPYMIYKGDDRYERLKSRKYAKGGEIVSKHRIPLKKKSLIDGPGKGQTDAIHTNAAEGSYIIPADVVSMLGDGSTDAGVDVINSFFDDVVRDLNPDVVHGAPRNETLTIPVALSKGEVYVKPHQVLALGRGHHSKGVKMLDSLRSNIRKHKIANGNDLPPKAKHIKSYMEA